MTTFSVTTSQDVTDPTDGLISLREAVDLANQSEGADTIIFATGAQGLIRLTEGELRVTEAVTIDGAGEVTITGDRNGNDITISGDITDVAASLVGEDRLADNSRILNFGYTAGEFTLKGLTLTGGRTESYYGNGGSAIRSTNSSVEFSIEQSSISGNSTAGSFSYGGAIKINGSRNVSNALMIIDSAISGNETSGDNAYGGAINTASAVEVTNSTISGNSTSGSNAKGGALYTTGQVTITNSTITGNRTEGDTEGGAIYARNHVTVSNSIILGNKSGASKGDDIYESDDADDTDTLIEVSGSNIIGSDATAFDVGEKTSGTGTAQNANADQVFAATEINAGVRSGVLANNGGAVLTIALKEDAANPALDAATISGTDARGFTRGVDLSFVDNGGTSDLGAFELQEQPIIAPTTNVRLTNDDDFLRATQLDDTVLAFGGEDTIIGLAGDDLLIGGAGNDRLSGSGGDDSLRGNAGEDTLNGNGGSDSISGNGGADVIVAGGGADTVKGGGGSDAINGGGGADLLNGGGGADVITGRGGNDMLIGGGGADAINGGGGHDQLEGGRGADTLAGRNGDDTLIGNGGADVFQFRTSDRNDTIMDFAQGQDRIEILNGATSFTELSIQRDGADVLITFGSGQITVISDDPGLFDAGDFIF